MEEGDSLATLLIRLRVQAGLSQEQLAAAANVSAQTISDIERGTTVAPRVSTIGRIAAGLGLDAALTRQLSSLRAQAGNTARGEESGTALQVRGDQVDGTFVATNLGQAVTYLRTRLGLSGTELGRRSRLSARTIADIEAGRRKRVHPANAISLADALELTNEPRAWFMTLASGTTVPDAMRLGAAEPAGIAGREQELAAVLALLEDHRLVSLTGSGGVGKTTLAEAVLAALDRPCVSMFLADVPAGEDLARAIALIGRFDEHAGADWMGQFGPLLPCDSVLLLDNLEHLRRGPTVIKEILSSRPDVTLLATSRTTIGLADACELQIRPLRLAAACRVFRAASDQAGRPIPESMPEVIEQICDRLDRLPLAITLAARWTRLMTPQEILARLDKPAQILRSSGAGPGGLGADVRHAAITHTVGWSLALISESARALFRGLTAYPAPWPLDLIEAIRPAADVLGALDELVQARLVTRTADAPGGTRYTMLQTVGDVGREELAADPGLTGLVLEGHAAHLLNRAKQIAPQLVTQDRAAALATGDQLALHVEGALRHLIDAGDQRAISLVASWWRYWKERGRYRGGLALITESLRTVAVTEPRDTAEAVYGAAALSYLAGVIQQSADLAADALARFQRLGDASGIGNLMSLIGMMELHGGRTREALDWYQRGLREVDDKAAPRVYAVLLANIAPVYAALDDLPAARAAANEAAARFQVLGDNGAAAGQLGNLGLWAARAGDRERAAELMHESRDLLMASGDFTNLIDAHLDLVKLHVDGGDAASAKAELDAARQLGRMADDTWGDALADALAAQIAVLTGDMTAARSLARVAMRKGETIAYQPAMVGAAVAEASAAAWSNDPGGALAAVRAGLAQSAQADEAAIVSLALIAAAVLMEGAGPATVDADLLALEQEVRLWASSPGGRPYAIAALAARRRGFSLTDARPPGSLPPIAGVRARALALCPPDTAVR